jgi:hypothetical protein
MIQKKMPIIENLKEFMMKKRLLEIAFVASPAFSAKPAHAPRGYPRGFFTSSNCNIFI